MTDPIKVYSTETPGLYRTEDGREAVRRHRWPAFPGQCQRCGAELQYTVGIQWEINSYFYCPHCVQVVGQGELL